MARANLKVDTDKKIVYIYEDAVLTPQEEAMVQRYVNGGYKQVTKKRGLTVSKIRRDFISANDKGALETFDNLYKAKKDDKDDLPGFYHATQFYNEWKRLRKVRAEEKTEEKKKEKVAKEDK